MTRKHRKPVVCLFAAVGSGDRAVLPRIPVWDRHRFKDNMKLMTGYYIAGIELGRNELTATRAQSEEFRRSAGKSGTPMQIRLTHERAGRIAFAEKEYAGSIAELEQVCRSKGETLQAQEYYGKSAVLHPLLQMNSAFVRAQAAQAARQ